MCISPLTLKRPREEWIPEITSTTVTRTVPCGKCVDCLARRRNSWSFRLSKQLHTSQSAAFITLTYENPPTSFNGIYTLEKTDLQKFIKRLRKYCKIHYKNANTIKYYAVGEYGTISDRPHYHLIIYNLPQELILRSEKMAKQIWKKGTIDIAICNLATINYTVNYVTKGTWAPKTDDDDRNPEFATMSKKLGSNYLTDEIYEYHKERLETTVVHPSGFRIPLPRYYKDQIFTDDEKAELEDVRQQILKMNWQEFANIDYKRIHDEKKTKIRIQQKTLITQRTIL